jgi:DNA-binding response OmpR family regulator
MPEALLPAATSHRSSNATRTTATGRVRLVLQSKRAVLSKKTAHDDAKRESVMTNRLLIVDDEPQCAATVARLLGSSSYEIENVASLTEAIGSLSRRCPDLVLLNLTLSNASGLELLVRIRQDESLKFIPVILLTTPDCRALLAQGFEAGADESVEKPFDGSVLQARVQMGLKLHNARRELVRARDAVGARNREHDQRQREQRRLVERFMHDLKNPLMIISGNLELLRSPRAVSASLVDAVTDAQDAAARICALVQDLTDVALVDDTHVPIERD